MQPASLASLAKRLATIVVGELIYALPPLKDLRVADLGAGTGRSGAALATAYPSIRLTLIDPDEEC